jgi:hypothetical protein
MFRVGDQQARRSSSRMMRPGYPAPIHGAPKKDRGGRWLPRPVYTASLVDHDVAVVKF